MEAKIQETSVSVTFGPQLPVPALSSFSATLNFFKEPLPFEFDTVNTLTIVLPVQAHNQDALATAVENLLQSLLSPGSMNFDIPTHLFTQKVVKSGNKILVQIAPQGSSQEKLAELKEMAVGMGVQTIFDNQKNQVKIGVACRPFSDLGNDMRNGESFFSALLKQAKLDVNVGLDDDLVPELTNVLNNFDPTLTGIVPFLFLSVFSRATVDLKFNSTSELPETFRKLLLNPCLVRMMSLEDMKINKVPEGLPEDSFKLLETIDGPIEIVASLSEMASLKIELRGQDFGVFLREFGKFIDKFSFSF